MKDKLKKIAIVLAAISALSACSVQEVKRSIDGYNQVKSQVKLGDSRQSVVALLEPLQINVRGDLKKDTDTYISDGKTVEIYYARSSISNDGLTTDDEFTPYIFHDDVLVGIGWAMLGGPKTQGQAVDNTYIYKQESSKRGDTSREDTSRSSAYCADAVRRGRPQDC